MLANMTGGDSENASSHPRIQTHIHTIYSHTRLHPHALVSLRVADHSATISYQAKAAKYRKQTHTLYTVIRGSLSAIFYVYCYCDSCASIRLLQLSFPTGPSRHLPPGNTVPEIIMVLL